MGDPQLTRCKVCGRELTARGLTVHLQQAHAMTREYHDLFYPEPAKPEPCPYEREEIAD